MLLVIDVGNTNLTLGLYRKTRLIRTGRLVTNRYALAKELGAWIRRWLPMKATLEGICIASVVPPIDEALRHACRTYLKLDPLFVTTHTRLGIKNLYKKPEEVGADRLVNAVAIHALYRKAVIGVDFGTATTFDCVSAKGDYLGGAICPGMELAGEWLAAHTAKLPRIAFPPPRKASARKPPYRALGKTTKESLQSGLFYGYIGLVEELLRRLKREMGGNPLFVLTGGLSTIMGPYLKTRAKVIPNLTLDGLRIIWELNQKGETL